MPISQGTGNDSSKEGPTTMVSFLPSVGAGAVDGDRDGDTSKKYVAFLEREEENYPAQPWFFYNQPLDDSGWVGAQSGSGGADATTTSGAPTASAGQDKGKDKGEGKSGGEQVLLEFFGWLFVGSATLLSFHVLLFV